MATYTNKPHGLIIAGNDKFELRTYSSKGGSEKVTIKNYPCLLIYTYYDFGRNFDDESIKGMEFVNTPAHQLCFELATNPAYVITNVAAGEPTHCLQPREWFHSWLEKNNVRWAMKKPRGPVPDMPVLFLRKRGDARLICDMLKDKLGAIPNRVSGPKIKYASISETRWSLI
jgi:hypothetical protein